MDQEFIQTSKQKLLEKKERLSKQLEDLTHDKKFDKNKVQVKWEDIGDKDEDNAGEVADFQDKLSLERELEESLEKINNALKKIEEGTYGKCKKCGGEIQKARLEAYAEAEQCIKCQSFKF